MVTVLELSLQTSQLTSQILFMGVEGGSSQHSGMSSEH